MGEEVPGPLETLKRVEGLATPPRAPDVGSRWGIYATLIVTAGGVLVALIGKHPEPPTPSAPGLISSIAVSPTIVVSVTTGPQQAYAAELAKVGAAPSVSDSSPGLTTTPPGPRVDDPAERVEITRDLRRAREALALDADERCQYFDTLRAAGKTEPPEHTRQRMAKTAHIHEIVTALLSKMADLGISAPSAGSAPPTPHCDQLVGAVDPGSPP